MHEAPYRRRILTRYFVVSYLAMLVNASAFLRVVKIDGLFAFFFSCAVDLTYSLVYLLPVFLPLLFVNWLLGRRRTVPTARSERRRTWILLALAVIGFALVQILITSDVLVFRAYGHHINGFLVNLIFTPGGIGALEMGPSTVLAIALLMLAFVAGQALLLVFVLSLGRIPQFWEIALSRRVLAVGILAVLGLTLFQGIACGVSELRGYVPVLAASNAFPLYAPVPFDKIGGSLGLTEPQRDPFSVKVDARHLCYPLRSASRIVCAGRDAPRPNIVWLVSESLRADMIDPEIMPATYAFARKSVWFRRHYSTGHETSMGMYGIFYGLHGMYWFPTLRDRRPPLVMDVLLREGYQIDVRTGANFNYPELDKTAFAGLPRSQLHESRGEPTWLSDSNRVTELIQAIDGRDPNRPFMSFMFFDSPHARYSFSEECAIRKPYMKEVNYIDIRPDNMTLIRNRYINACHQVDIEIDRILRRLEQDGLMQSTIVIITADHGEEFLEKGRWGHGSSFSEEQVRVPLIIWAPGETAREVTRMTSHVDIAPTLLRKLGVTNPPSDYSVGINLLGSESRDYAVICNWDCAVYVDKDFKAILPVRAERYIPQRVTTSDDAPVRDQDAFYATHGPQLRQVARELREFSR